MLYNDGVKMDDNMRVTFCPKCNNEQFSSDVQFCRICGFLVYNWCEGEATYDTYGNYEETIKHKNPGNARFCETCGKPTVFLQERVLLPYDEIQEEYVEGFLKLNPDAFGNGNLLVVGDTSSTNKVDDDDLPF